MEQGGRGDILPPAILWSLWPLQVYVRDLTTFEHICQEGQSCCPWMNPPLWVGWGSGDSNSGKCGTKNVPLNLSVKKNRQPGIKAQ